MGRKALEKNFKKLGLPEKEKNDMIILRVKNVIGKLRLEEK